MCLGRFLIHAQVTPSGVLGTIHGARDQTGFDPFLLYYQSSPVSDFFFSYPYAHAEIQPDWFGGSWHGEEYCVQGWGLCLEKYYASDTTFSLVYIILKFFSMEKKIMTLPNFREFLYQIPLSSVKFLHHHSIQSVSLWI